MSNTQSTMGNAFETARSLRGILLAAIVLIGGCAGPAAFKMTADDNHAPAVDQALALANARSAGPRNALGKPLVIAVQAGPPRKLVAWDMAAGKELWSVEANVESRVAISGGLCFALEGADRIVARDLATGASRWSISLDGASFLGLAAEQGRAYVVVKEDTKRWSVLALADGSVVWRKDASGPLGAPTASGGLVLVPFLQQWLTLIDAQTGEQVARIRQKDEAISFVRAGSDGVFFGSRGVFRLDSKAASGTRDGSTYFTTKLPDFLPTQFHFDAFAKVQAGYSVYDRQRLLWRGEGTDGLKFQNDEVVALSFRFFFAMSTTTGKLLWAHRHPRVDVVAAEHLGETIVYLSQQGELRALDAKTGAMLVGQDMGGRILGATFDAEGYRPAGDAKPVDTVDALAEIANDRDSRLVKQRLFAVEVLSTADDPRVVEVLLQAILDPNAPAEVREKAAEGLGARGAVSDVPVLVKALQVHHDFLTGSAPQGVAPIARALGRIGSPDAVPVLAAQLFDPAQPLPVLKDLAWALGRVKSKDAISHLRTFLLMHRADPEMEREPEALGAVMESLVLLDGASGRELVAFVAEDPLTVAPVSELARRVLAAGAETVQATKE